MTQEEIKYKGIKIIAEFMKGEFEIRTLGDNPYHYKEEWVVFPADDSLESRAVAMVSQMFRSWNEVKKSNLYFKASRLQYHSSWDWQIPAWSKAIQQYDLPRKSVYKVRYSAATEDNNPELGFKILVELITELNNQTKQQ